MVTGDPGIVEIGVNEDTPAASNTPSGPATRKSAISSDAQGGRIGDPDTILEADSYYVVASESGVADEVMPLLCG